MNELVEKVSNTSWYGLALQALIILATHEGICPSSVMAKKLGFQSTFLRKVLTHLVKADIIQAKEGRDGGYSLNKSPEEITLAGVYHALTAELFPKGFLNVQSKECFAPPTQDALCDLRDEMEGWIIEGLEKKTLADLLNKRLS
ncbi:RrF2 family transcriptional regulator [Bacillus weihaiensis]|uniref:RrF2 family transcriptional regulator n=1 Tax=Bacillus weihaiensis TaxID=1547283 RepID=UPI0026825688